MDHYFPFNPKKDIPAFGKYLEGAVWGMLLEKAWAKIYGSYRIISGGFNSTTFATLTGAPTDKILTLCSEFKEKFEEWNKCKYPLCVNSRKRSTLN